MLAILEGWSRLLGWYDFAIRKDRHMVWDMAYTQKGDVRQHREQGEAQKDGQPAAASLLADRE